MNSIISEFVVRYFFLVTLQQILSILKQKMSKIIKMQGIRLPSNAIFHKCDVFMQVGSLNIDLLNIRYNQLTKNVQQGSNQCSFFEIDAKIRLPQNVNQVKIIVHPKILNLWTQAEQILIDVLNQKPGDQRQLKFVTQLGLFKTYLIIEQEKLLANLQTSISSTDSQIESFKVADQLCNVQSGKQDFCYDEDQKDKKTNSKQKNQPASIFKTVKIHRNSLHACSDGALMNTKKDNS